MSVARAATGPRYVRVDTVGDGGTAGLDEDHVRRRHRRRLGEVHPRRTPAQVQPERKRDVDYRPRAGKALKRGFAPSSFGFDSSCGCSAYTFYFIILDLMYVVFREARLPRMHGHVLRSKDRAGIFLFRLLASRQHL